MVEELQTQISLHISSTTKVEGAHGSTTPEADRSKEKEILEVQKEPKSTFR
jgi:hypothetical protein